jgi:TetR/AcrR family transcriptional regulator
VTEADDTRDPAAGTPDDGRDDSQETREKILDAAHDVFVRRGTAGARMQEIAKEAGVNQALLHYYFRDKASLAEAVFVRAARSLLPPVLATLASDLTIEEKVQRVVDIEFDNLTRAPYLPAYLLSELNHHPERAGQLARAIVGERVDAVVPDVFGALSRQIDAAVARGELRPISPHQFVANLVSLCIFPFAARPLLAFLLETDGVSFEDFTARRREELPGFFLEAIRP